MHFSSLVTDVPPPDAVVLSAGQETVSLGFPLTDYSESFTLQLDYFYKIHADSLITKDSSTVQVEGLSPGTEYTFSIRRIADNGNQSEATSLSVYTGKSEKHSIKTTKKLKIMKCVNGHLAHEFVSEKS